MAECLPSSNGCQETTRSTSRDAFTVEAAAAWPKIKATKGVAKSVKKSVKKSVAKSTRK
jgi:hypothetical protein